MITFAGGDGTTKEHAIIILNARTTAEGVRAEYAAVEAIFGTQGETWQLVRQVLSQDAFSGKSFDVIDIHYQQAEYRIWFDISDFFGKI